MKKTIRYAKRLIEFDSTSSRSNRLISKYLEMKLVKHGFVIEKVGYKDRHNIRKVNLIAKKGSGRGGLVYLGHSDTVPAKKWFSKKQGPFEPGIARQRLYGRGACDMKGSIACILTASQMVAWDDLTEPLYLVITADEEVGFHGARHVVAESKFYREMVEGGTRGIIGEPTSLDVVHAHKGSIELTITSRGKAGHSSSRKTVNANLMMFPFLEKMRVIYNATETDPQWQNQAFDPPSIRMNIRIRDDSPALNITPGKSTCSIYLRTMPEVDIASLLERIAAAAKMCNLQMKVKKWGEFFWQDPNSEFVQQALKLVHQKEARTVGYGTDGGIFSELENKIVLGPGSIAQAHTRNEWISLEQLNQGTELYAKMIRHWCCR